MEGPSAQFSVVGDPDALAWSSFTEVTVVCLVEEPKVTGGAELVLYDDGGRWAVPSGVRQPGEDVWDDSVLRIPLEAMGFRRQDTHPFAVDRAGRHVVFWVLGGSYAGSRTAATKVPWWAGPVAAGADLLRAQGDEWLAALVEGADESRRTMSYERRNADVHRTLVAPYLKAATPHGGSGFGGSDAEWRESRGVLLDALDPLGTPGSSGSPIRFLDHGCANGHLAASIASWAEDLGIEVDPYGVDIAEELVERARADHPALASHFFVGDALTWVHPSRERFDVVHVLLDAVPPAAHPQLLRHQLDQVVAPGGRLVLSEYGDPPTSRSAEAQVVRAGFTVAGRTRQPTRGGRDRGHPSVWVESPAQ